MKKDLTPLQKANQANAAALLLEQQNEMAAKALDMRRSGRSWWDIAEELQIPETHAAALVADRISAAAALVDEGTKRFLLAMEVDRLDALQSAAWPNAMTGDTRSIDSVLKIIQTRSKLLGLEQVTDAATVARTVIVAGTTDEYVQAMREVTTRRVDDAVPSD